MVGRRTMAVAVGLAAAVACSFQVPTGSTGTALPAAGEVDIYLAAGEPSGDASCHFTANSSSAAACELWRVRWDLARGRLVDAEKVVGDGVAAWQPAVSPDGSRVAYTRRISASQTAVYVKALGGGRASDPGDDVTAGASGMRVWAWPSWRDDGRLLVSRPASDVQCTDGATCRKIDRWSTTWEVALDGTRAKTVTEVLGTGAFAFEDVAVNPKDRSLVAGHGQAVAGTGAPGCDGSTPCSGLRDTPYPYVVDLDSGAAWGFALATTEAAYAVGGQPLTLGGCAHLAWSPDGARLMCTEQSTDAIQKVNDNNKLYDFGFDRGARSGADKPAATTVAPLFDHEDPPEIFGLSGTQRCEEQYHKYAEFCGDGSHVVASMLCGCQSEACAAQGGRTGIVEAHVHVIDASRPSAPVYHDVTAALEAHLGLAENALRSFTATCVGAGGPSGAKAAAPATRAPARGPR